MHNTWGSRTAGSARLDVCAPARSLHYPQLHPHEPPVVCCPTRFEALRGSLIGAKALLSAPQWTLCFWLRPTVAKRVDYVVYKEGVLRCQVSNGQFDYLRCTFGAGGYLRLPLPLGAWSHYALQWDSTTAVVSAYVNGSLCTQSSDCALYSLPGQQNPASLVPSEVAINSTNLFIPHQPGQYHHLWEGEFDELRLYDALLSVATIQLLSEVGFYASEEVPKVAAGPAQTIWLSHAGSASVWLRGNSSAHVHVWVAVEAPGRCAASGSGLVQVQNASALTTEVLLEAGAGTYVFELQESTSQSYSCSTLHA